MTNRSTHRSTAKRLRILIIAFVVAAASVIAAPVAANAVYMLGGMNSASYRVKDPGYNSTWMTPINAARTNWNTRCAPCSITWSDDAAARIVAVNKPTATWNGQYQPSFGTSFRIELNKPKISATPPFSTSLRSTTAHEFGHSFSLGDYVDRGNTSLMSGTRDRMVVYAPTNLDLVEVDDYY
ncbi:hypothetical protein ACH0CG_06665 [Microbacterium sp. 179-I 1D1 NHS]|uniref:hypothetical protein n=1 Tax=Microbacterium sp. 179-I 1D1 NHS TaxID=3374298 RepID=UPI00387962CF